MINRFIPDIFSDQGLSETDFALSTCEEYILGEMNLAQEPVQEIFEIAKQEWNSRDYYSTTSWADWFMPLSNKEFVDFVKERLEGQFLVDIGGGHGIMNSFAFFLRQALM